MLDTAQNSHFSDEIDHKATKMQADAHLQNGLPGKAYSLFGELKFSVSKILQVICLLGYVSCSARPIGYYLFVLPLSMDLAMDLPRGFQQRYRPMV